MRVGRARTFWALWARFDRLLMAFCWENGLFWCHAGAGGAWRAIRGAHVVDDTHGGYGTGGSTRESPNERGRPPQRAHFALLRGRFQALNLFVTAFFFVCKPGDFSASVVAAKKTRVEKERARKEHAPIRRVLCFVLLWVIAKLLK